VLPEQCTLLAGHIDMALDMLSSSRLILSTPKQ